MFLRELTHSVKDLKGIGPATMANLRNLGITTIAELLLHFPREYEDRSVRRTILESAQSGLPANTVITVTGHEYFGFGPRQTLKVAVEDESGPAVLVCFGRNFLSRVLLPGARFFLFGRFELKFGELQTSVFDIEEYPHGESRFGRILPIYPLSGSLTQTVLRKFTAQAVEKYAASLETELPAYLIDKHGLFEKADAVKQIHYPDSPEALERAKRSLIYEELFHLQLLVARRAYARKGARKRHLDVPPTALQRSVVERLPFRLTPDQEAVLDELRGDYAAPTPMARLLQGDVGSGKTLVAFLAALPYIEEGLQAVFMAPTELLARQHAENAAKFLEPAGVRLGFFSGSVKDDRRARLLEALEAGEIDLLIGTHAVFSKDVEFRSLGLVIVDEQQRFGVLQRMSLMEKGEMPDLLLMTATPIPRTLALTAFGDLDVSYIRTMPEGRKKVITHLARQGNEAKVYDWIGKEIERGRQAYFVYPLIGQSDRLSLKDAESMYRKLSTEVFPRYTIGLIHSRLPEEDKREIMQRFNAGEIRILVATSVIEVGVDVRNVSCIVIEHAERFGLSALHQLRGRVGRGDEQGYAFLVYGENLTEDGKRRLKVMMEETDGFKIAEEDMRIRGPGELAGIRQAGYFRFAIADLGRDMAILVLARDDAAALTERDPGLLEPEHKPLRELLHRAPPFPETFLQGG